MAKKTETTKSEAVKKNEDLATKRLREYLESRAKRDAHFKEMYESPKKNIENCVQYVKECAQKAAVNGASFCDDDEVYGWAVHYYNEPDVEPKHNVKATMGTTTKGDAKTVKKVKEKKEAETGSCSADELLDELENL